MIKAGPLYERSYFYMEFWGYIYDPKLILGLNKFSVSSLADCCLGRRLDNLVIIGGSSKLETTTHQNI
jgi:hypothetical protein